MVAADRGDAKIARLLVKHNADFQPSGPKACPLFSLLFCCHHLHLLWLAALLVKAQHQKRLCPLSWVVTATIALTVPTIENQRQPSVSLL